MLHLSNSLLSYHRKLEVNGVCVVEDLWSPEAATHTHTQDAQTRGAALRKDVLHTSRKAKICKNAKSIQDIAASRRNAYTLQVEKEILKSVRIYNTKLHE